MSREAELVALLDFWSRPKLSSPERVAQIKALVAAGADINARAPNGESLLALAVRPGVSGLPDPDVATVQCLLDLGADPHSVTLNRAIALNRFDPPSGIERSKELLRLLASHGVAADPDQPLSHYTSADRSLYELLLSLGGDVTRRDEAGCTPLHQAVLFRHVSLVELLLSLGVELNGVDHEGKTPLGLARRLDAHSEQQQEAKRAIVAMLERAGAAPHSAFPKTATTTPLDRAGLRAVAAERKLPQVEAAFVDDSELDSYQELVGRLPRKLHSDHFLSILRTCSAALGDPEARRLTGDQSFERPFFHHGDLEIDGHLFVEAPFAVTGKLVVTGCLKDLVDSSTIIVVGDVGVDNLLTGGEICVGGEICARGVVYASDNDYLLRATTLRAQAVIVDHDRAIAADVAAAHHFDAHSEQWRALFVPELFGDGDDSGALDVDQLRERLLQRQPIFR